jgi:hypothetical protein
MKYQLIVSDNNGSDYYTFNNKRDALIERTKIISAYGYNKGKGFKRVSLDNVVVFDHAVYSTVVFTIEGLTS